MLNKTTVYTLTFIIIFKYNLDKKLASLAYVLESHGKVNSEKYCSGNWSWTVSFPTCTKTYFTLVLEE